MSEHQIQLTTRDGRTLSFPCAADQDVISAAEEQDIYLSSQCRTGSCGGCTAHREAGGYELGPHNKDTLSADDRARGQVLLCRTYPRSDLVLALPYDYELIRFEKPSERDGEIVEKTFLNHDTVKLVLALREDEHGNAGVEFEPGQFMELYIPGSDIKRPYSLASVPNWDGTAEFLIKLRPGGQFSEYLRTAQVGEVLHTRGPIGAFTLHDNGLRPRWFVAGGCGVASITSMLRRMAEWHEPHPARLFFGVWDESDTFYVEELQQLAAEYPNLQVTFCVTEASEAWPHYHGSVATAFETALAKIGSPPDIYVCGSPGLINKTIGIARDQGVPESQIAYEKFLATAQDYDESSEGDSFCQVE